MTHPPGTIVIPVSDQMRFSEFFIDYSNLQVPPGTTASINRSASVVGNLNTSIKSIPDHHEWAWFIGDDHVFPGDILTRLLDHQVDVVVPLCSRRAPPFHLLIMREEAGWFDTDMDREYPGWIPYMTHEVPDELFTVIGAGGAGMLVRRHVLDAIGYPWFENHDGVYLNEDLTFCRKIRKAGFEIHCDPHAYLGHIGQMYIWPTRHEGNVAIKIDCGGPPGNNELIIGDPVPAAF